MLLVTRFAGGPRLLRSNSAYSPQQEPLKKALGDLVNHRGPRTGTCERPDTVSYEASGATSREGGLSTFVRM